MLIRRSNNVQLFGFTPRGHRKGPRQAIGMCLRLRARGRWRHFMVYVYWPRRDLRRARGCVTLEAKTWLSGPGTAGYRLTVKAFVRLKVGLGGPHEQGREDARDLVERFIPPGWGTANG